MSEIYEALRDAERQKDSRRPVAIPAPFDAPAPASGRGSAGPEGESKPSLIRSVRGRLERLKAKSSIASGAPAAPAGQSSPAGLTPSSDGESEGTSGRDRALVAAISQPQEDTSLELLRQLAALEGRFARLAEQLSGALDELRAGRPASAILAAELTASEADFNEIHSRVVELAPSSALAETATSSSATLNSLLTVLQAAMEVERERREFDEIRRRAMAELEPVFRLVHREGAAFAPLDQCQDQARQLATLIANAQWPDLPTECPLLADRQHAFSRVLDLVRHGDELSDEAWEAAEEAVALSFGKPLAVAVSRGRLRLATGGSEPS